MSRKIKICFVSPFAYGLFNPKSDLKFGGAEVQMYFLATELAKDDDFDVNFVVLDLGQPKQEEYGEVKVYKSFRRGRSLFNLIKAPLKLWQTLRKISPDIIISRAHGVEPGFCALYSKLSRSKFIYSIASNSDVSGEQFEGLRGKIFQFGFKHANLLVAQSRDQIRILENQYPQAAQKAVLIKNSFPLKDHLDEKKSILWVGSSADVKRPQIFLDLAQEFPEEKFVMIITESKVNPELWKETKKRADKLQNVEFFKKISFTEIDNYFAQAKVFVNSSVFEGFPNTFLQSLSVQVPLLSLKVDPDNFIVSNKCGLVCDDDFEKLKNNLRGLLENQEERERMGRQGQEYLRQNHNIKKNIEKWKKEIKKILP